MAGGPYTVADLDAAIASLGLYPQLDGDRRRISCPAANHPGDRSEANCSVWVGPDGSIGAKCHSAGCSHREILEGLGLYRGSNGQSRNPTSSQHSNKRQPGPNDRTPASREKLGPIMAKHDYTDADGTLVYQVVRYAPKEFRQRQPDGKGGWIWNLAGVHRILYRLPELLAADPDQPVFVCEGEKDADNLAALGLVATTCSEGAGKWQLINDLSALEGRQVVILPDNDPGGQGLRHAEEVATSLQGIAASVKRLELPGLPANGGDVSDWIDSGGTAGNLLELAADAPEWAAPRGPTESGDQSIPSSDWLENLLQSATDDPGVLLEPDTVIRLRALGVADRVRLRAEVSNRKIKVPLSWLDKEIWGTSSKADEEIAQGRAIEWPEIEPWPEAVASAELLRNLSFLVSRYIHLPSAAADAIALWVIHTHLHPRLEVSTFLNLTSATKRCGKSLLLEILAELVYRPLPLSGRVTSAALFRVIERHAPTLLLDEADTFFGKDDELRGVINGSQRRDLAHVLRCVGEEHEPRQFVTWCPKAIAGIGKLPDTVVDRSLVLNLERRPANAEPLPRWRDRDREAIERLKRQLTCWVADNEEAILAARASVSYPPGLHDRARDAWESLLAIAEVAGGEWAGQGGRAWAACQALCPNETDETGVREQLLADLRVVFAEAGDPEILPTQEILTALHQLESRPWSEWGRSNRPLTPRGLSSLLSPFRVKPRNQRSGGQQSKGYRREDLEPIWERYALSPSKEGSPIRPAVPMPSETAFPTDHHPSQGLKAGRIGNPRNSVQEPIGTVGRMDYPPSEDERGERTIEPIPTPSVNEPDSTWIEGEL